jgi:hypothetical protein
VNHSINEKWTGRGKSWLISGGFKGKYLHDIKTARETERKLGKSSDGGHGNVTSDLNLWRADFDGDSA